MCVGGGGGVEYVKTMFSMSMLLLNAGCLNN